MFDVDVDRLLVLKPWRDGSFWIALAWSIAAVVAAVAPGTASWAHEHQAALLAAAAPLTTWLVLHGIVRVKSVRATAQVMAAQVDAHAALIDHDAALAATQPFDEVDEPRGVTDVADVRAAYMAQDEQP